MGDRKGTKYSNADLSLPVSFMYGERCMASVGSVSWSDDLTLYLE